MLSSCLETNVKCIIHGPADADFLIVQSTVESAALMDTVLISDDTDQPVLLYNLASLGSHI